MSLDVNIQKYAERGRVPGDGAEGARAVSVIVMNPQNGEIYAMVNARNFISTPCFPWQRGWGRFRKGKTGSFERHVEEPVHQRHL